MAASTSNPDITLEVREDECPNPSHVTTPNIIYPYPTLNFATNFVTVKLNGKNKYNVWNTQMLCLLSSHHMLGFINGQFLSPSENGKGKVEDMEAWVASDSLVKGWILGSLYEQAAMNVVNRLKSEHKDFTAKDVWDELQRSYGPPVLQQAAQKEDWTEEEEAHMLYENDRIKLHKIILEGNIKRIDDFVGGNKSKLIEKSTNNGNTALHVAVGSSTNNHKFLEELFEMIPANNTLSDLRNSDGSTLLHVAAIVGNTSAVDILVERNPYLLLEKDNKDQTPLALSLSNVHSETSRCLLKHIKEKRYDALFSGKSGEELRVLAISSKDFGLACMMIIKNEAPPSDAVLMAIAQYFPRELNFWETRYGIADEMDARVELCKSRNERLMGLCGPCVLRFIEGYYWILTLSEHFLKAIVRPFIEDTFQIHLDADTLLGNECLRIFRGIEFTAYHHYYTGPIFEATRLNAFEVVKEIVYFFPDAMWSTNENGHNFIQYSVINRSEKIYSLLYQMSEHKNIYKTIKDSSGNNMLHLAAILAPSNKLNLISGAALQIQRELQWFKEVEGFVCPLNRIQKNSDDETPEMVFTREHKDLVMEGEKWIKATAESYTITAALITTVVFAAAITVPGGNDEKSGIPVFTNNIAFTIFAISDAISLFTAVTSLLMFLSILTARFAEQDFLFKLPRRLIIGLTMLFLSTTAMIIAFGATLFLVFGQRHLWILFPIGALTCLPITSFVTLQFPLIADLTRATYGHSIFNKRKPVYYFY